MEKKLYFCANNCVMTSQEIQSIKQRFSIIGNNPALNRAIEVAVQVAKTDLTVLVTGESVRRLFRVSSTTILRVVARSTLPSTAVLFRKEP